MNACSWLQEISLTTLSLNLLLWKWKENSCLTSCKDSFLQETVFENLLPERLWSGYWRWKKIQSDEVRKFAGERDAQTHTNSTSVSVGRKKTKFRVVQAEPKPHFQVLIVEHWGNTQPSWAPTYPRRWHCPPPDFLRSKFVLLDDTWNSVQAIKSIKYTMIFMQYNWKHKLVWVHVSEAQHLIRRRLTIRVHPCSCLPHLFSHKSGHCLNWARQGKN